MLADRDSFLLSRKAGAREARLGNGIGYKTIVIVRWHLLVDICIGMSEIEAVSVSIA